MLEFPLICRCLSVVRVPAQSVLTPISLPANQEREVASHTPSWTAVEGRQHFLMSASTWRTGRCWHSTLPAGLAWAGHLPGRGRGRRREGGTPSPAWASPVATALHGLRARASSRCLPWALACLRPCAVPPPVHSILLCRDGLCEPTCPQSH